MQKTDGEERLFEFKNTTKPLMVFLERSEQDLKPLQQEGNVGFWNHFEKRARRSLWRGPPLGLKIIRKEMMVLWRARNTA
jgi:hypothetical protein